MAKYFFRRAADEQRKRILAVLNQTQPGTREYRELENQLGAYDIMEQKQREGTIQPIDLFKFTTNVLVTGLVLTADQWFPAVAGKLKIIDFATKLIR